MARKSRIETADGLYHVLNRGNYRSFIFESDGAKGAFEEVLFEGCERFGWDLLAYVVMGNHFHLCIATPKGNLSQGMAWVQGTFAKRFNRFRGESGHLFQGRFKSLIVEPGRHLVDLVNYIHLNPVQSGLCSIDELMRYRWSSLHHFPKRRRRPGFLDASWMDYEDGLSDTRSCPKKESTFIFHIRGSVDLDIGSRPMEGENRIETVVGLCPEAKFVGST